MGIIFIAAFAVLLLRRPETVTRAAFFYEDGQVFYIGAYFGSLIDQLFRQYEGYLLVVPRLVAAAERLVEPATAPLLGGVVALGIVAGLATYIASDRLATVFPSRPMRLALAAGVVLLPGAWEALGSMTLVQWYLAIFLLLAGIASPPNTRVIRVIEPAAIVLAGLTGPFSLLFAPIYWLRVAVQRDRWSWITALAISGTALVQLAVLLLSGERSGALPSWGAIGEVLTVRLWTSVIGGLWTSGLLAQGIPVIAAAFGSALLILALLTISTALPVLPRVALAYGAGVVIGATLVDQPDGFPESPLLAGRYFLLLSTLVVFVAMAALFRLDQIRGLRRVAVVAVCGLLIIGVVGDFRLVPHPDYGWSQRAACIGGPVPCDIPVEFPNVWTVHWPGSSGVYIQPNPR